MKASRKSAAPMKGLRPVVAKVAAKLVQTATVLHLPAQTQALAKSSAARTDLRPAVTENADAKKAALLPATATESADAA